ncbi:MAG: hypothetical protein KDK76_03990 [Chlamydiia bacterium]|nr:hypothetical protein [Chlamydiia bacterium]
MATVRNQTDPLFFIQLNSNLYQIDCSDENSSERIWTLIKGTDQESYQANPELSDSCEKISALGDVFYFSKKDGLVEGQIAKDSPTSKQVETDHEKCTCIDEFRFKIEGKSNKCIIGSPILVQTPEKQWFAIGVMHKNMKGVALYRSDGSFFNPALIQGNDLGDQRGATEITIPIQGKNTKVSILVDEHREGSNKDRYAKCIVKYPMNSQKQNHRWIYRFLNNNKEPLDFNNMGNEYHSNSGGMNENQFYNRVKQEFIKELEKPSCDNTESKQEKPKSPIELLKTIEIPDFGRLETYFKIEQSKGSITMSLNLDFLGLFNLNDVIACINAQFSNCQPTANNETNQIFIDPQQITLPPPPQPELLKPPQEFKIKEGYAKFWKDL